MPTYIIGDIQGCYAKLQELLEFIEYHPKHDRLGFVGDLVNRGPQSLQTLRFIKNLDNPMVVLGNHDLYLLALGFNCLTTAEDTTLDKILNARDKVELLDWLRQQPLIYYNDTLNFLMVHAGIPPQWSVKDAIQYGNCVQEQLRADNFLDFLKVMEGNEPNHWHADLKGFDRLRYIVNALTRIRFCDKHGGLDLTNKSKTSTDPTILQPWFEWRNDATDIVYGHWAALEADCQKPGYIALDTGCVYGGKLTAIRMEDKKRFCVDC